MTALYILLAAFAGSFIQSASGFGYAIVVMSILPLFIPFQSAAIVEVLSALAMVACSVLFSWFIDMSSRYSLVYGSLASLIILLVWLYFCGNILVIGAVVGQVWARGRWRGDLT